MSEPPELSTIERLLAARTPPERLPEVVEALGPAIERGHHLAVVASEGARLCRLYAAAAIRDLAPGPEGTETRGLVLTATPDRAWRLARSIDRVGGAIGWHTVAWPAGREPPIVSGPTMIVGTPSTLLADLRGGTLPLGELRLLVLDDVAALEDEWPAVDGLLQADAPDLRRIAATHRYDEHFETLLERRLPRARRWPGELFETSGSAGSGGKGTGAPLEIGAGAGYDDRLGRLVACLHEWAELRRTSRAVIWCGDEGTADSVAAALRVEGFAVPAGSGAAEAAGAEVAGAEAVGAEEDEGAPADPGDAGIEIRTFGTPGPEDTPGIAFGLPWTAAELESALGSAPIRVAIVEGRHVAQLELTARRLGWAVRPLGDAADAFDDELSAFRSRVEDEVRTGDLALGSLLVEPLVERHGLHRVSAALAGLCRELSRRAAPAGETGKSAPATGAQRASRPAWTRVYVNVGKKDGASPGDLVGAITGETEAAAAQIGKIDVRRTFSLVDIDSMIVDEVIDGLRGVRIRGRDILARPDRGS